MSAPTREEDESRRGGFDGEADGSEGVAPPGVTTRDVSGERRVAFVMEGSANRVTAFARGFVLLMPLGPGRCSAMRPTALGVGVAGGGAGAPAGL